jgi:hypothetical protein
MSFQTEKQIAEQRAIPELDLSKEVTYVCGGILIRLWS